MERVSVKPFSTKCFQYFTALNLERRVPGEDLGEGVPFVAPTQAQKNGPACTQFDLLSPTRLNRSSNRKNGAPVLNGAGKL
jgi:hypothetical protein